MKIRLQSVGWRNAIPAKELKIGDVILYNFGEKGTIVNIGKSKTGKSIQYTVRSKSGDWDRKTSLDRLFAVARLN